jgi:O-antigen/teichoic acid export membrane protein
VWGSTGLLVLGRLWSSGCTLAALYLLAGHLSGSDFGRYTFYLAVFLVLDSLVDLGTGQVAVQHTADEPRRIMGVLRALRRVRLCTGLAGAALVGGSAFLMREPGAGWILLASLYPVTHVLELSTLVFKNEIAWARPVTVRAIAASASLAFVVVLHSRGVQDPALFLLAVATGSTLGNVLLHLAGRRVLPPRGTETEPIGPLLRAALPMGLAGLCQQTYFYVDNVFVRALEGEEALGHYNVAVRIMSWSIMAAVYASLAALPWLTRAHRAGGLGPALARLAQPTFALAGLGTGLLWPFAGSLLGLFGADFASAAPALRWLLLAALTVDVGAALLTGVVAAGRSRAVLAIAALGLGVNLAGNALLVPRSGISGAALATFATEATVAFGALVVLARAGSSPLAGRGAWRWLGGPLGFGLGLGLATLV